MVCTGSARRAGHNSVAVGDDLRGFSSHDMREMIILWLLEYVIIVLWFKVCALYGEKKL